MDLLGVSVIATPREDVSEAQLASLASDLSSALSASPLSFNGSPLNPIGKPEFVIMDGTSSRTGKNACSGWGQLFIDMHLELTLL